MYDTGNITIEFNYLYTYKINNDEKDIYYYNSDNLYWL